MSQKILKKLQDRKNREETGLFLVEGKKNIHELLASDFSITTIYSTLEASAEFERRCALYSERTGLSVPQLSIVSEDKLAAMGTFKSNNAGIAIAVQRAPLPQNNILKVAHDALVLVLDDIRDPGNLGTIIRTADWFGITHIVTSETSADYYNPKVIAASMGSFTRVQVHSVPLHNFLSDARSEKIQTIGAFLEGENIFETTVPHTGLLIMGSESHGINNELVPFIDRKVTIPRYGNAESLNVAIATAIILGRIQH